MTYKIEKLMYYVVFEEIPSVKRILKDHGHNENGKPFKIGTERFKVLTFDNLTELENFLKTLEIPEDYDLTKHLNNE